MKATYGPEWRTPTTGFHGKSEDTPDEPLLRKALLQKLSVTAWGDVPYHQRLEQCAKTAKRPRYRQASPAGLALP